MDESLSILIKQLVTNSTASYALKRKLLNALDPDYYAIWWAVDDLEQQAETYEEQGGDEIGSIYDRSKFKDTLERMMREHDCNHGISWETMDYYLDEYCRFPEK